MKVHQSVYSWLVIMCYNLQLEFLYKLCRCFVLCKNVKPVATSGEWDSVSLYSILYELVLS